jgi:hypothetical protein
LQFLKIKSKIYVQNFFIVGYVVCVLHIKRAKQYAVQGGDAAQGAAAATDEGCLKTAFAAELSAVRGTHDLRDGGWVWSPPA